MGTGDWVVLYCYLAILVEYVYISLVTVSSRLPYPLGLLLGRLGNERGNTVLASVTCIYILYYPMLSSNFAFLMGFRMHPAL